MIELNYCPTCGEDEEFCYCIKCKKCGSVDGVQSNDVCEGCNLDDEETKLTYSNTGRHE